MNRKLRLLLIVACTTVLLAFTSSHGGKYFEIAKNIEIFTNVFKELNTWYVDDLDPATVMRTGIDAMVGALDPFTNYYSESQIESYRQTETKYDGIGADIRVIDDWPTIVEPYENSPAVQAGLKAGDQILEINGESAAGRSADDVQDILRGVPGTTARLKILRPGTPGEIDIVLTRGAVRVPNVPYKAYVAKDIGYIALTTFTQDAGRNVANALRDLRTDNPEIKGVILDLRGNGGGLLREAINVSNVFIDKNERIVSTRGKVMERDQEYFTRNDATDLEIPLVVLIDRRSASASEIVSGAVQDLDRGVVVGQRSYGKGLVQNTRQVGYNAQLKMTTARYYIPSGRSIQSAQYDNGEPRDIPDDERTPFRTRKGRTVLDGGGVTPDIVLDEPERPEILRALKKEHLIFKYVTEYCLLHDDIGPVSEFRFTDYAGFLGFLKQSGFEFRSSAEETLASLEQQVDDLHLSQSVKNDILKLRQQVGNETGKHLDKYRDRIIEAIETDIIGRYYFERGKTELRLKDDPELREAIALLTNPSKYQSILR